ncbi:MAG: 50S ribosomal protein L22 [Parcubacteria group bacterium]|nr:50S ribosomal protein L22 [Parcubacteria group bacterium]
MDIHAQLKYLRMAPRKVRRVADRIRGLGVSEAEVQLDMLPKAASEPLRKLLKSAVNNAEKNFSVGRERLFVRNVTVDGGPVLKRYRPRAYGRAFPILKRTSHVRMVIDTRSVKSVDLVEPRREAEEPRGIVRRRTGLKKGVVTDAQAKPREVRSVRRFFQRKSV